MLRIKFDRDIEMVARNIAAKWTLAEANYNKEVAEGKDAKWRKWVLI